LEDEVEPRALETWEIYWTLAVPTDLKPAGSKPNPPSENRETRVAIFT
jgi:hypothetical protein